MPGAKAKGVLLLADYSTRVNRRFHVHAGTHRLKQEAEEVVMESTAQYWKPVWEALERYWKPIREKREGAGREVGNTAFSAGAIQSRAAGTQEGSSVKP